MLIDGDILPWARLQIRQQQQRLREWESRWGLGAVRISEATFEVVAKFLPLTFGVGFDRVTDEKGDHRSEAKGIWK
jgi:hypothetical protein